jgi:hypothetical protein
MALARSVLFGEAPPHAPAAADAPRTRIVERFRVHGDPIDFRELCRRALAPATRLLVLDLDRTVHFGRNMGELLGWEICAYLGYGGAYTGERPGRARLDPSRPRATLRYLALGARLWGPPGLFYLLWGKIAWRAQRLRRRAFLRFGPEVIRAVQRVPQHALLHQIAALPRAVVNELSARVFNRHAGDQTIDRDDVAWLREQYPGIRVVISSASPRPIVAVAAAALGVDDFVCTEVEDGDDAAASPCDLSRLGRPPGAPRRISRPSRQRINAGVAKLEALHARYPELADPAVESAGISDTGYGEDHAFTELLGTVIDVNSGAPFPPIVAASSPTRADHAALLLTRREPPARDAGAPWRDPRRRPAPPALDLDARGIAARLGRIVDEVEAAARALEACEEELSAKRAAARAALVALEPWLERTVERYNAGEAALVDVEAVLAEQRFLAARVVAVERPLSAAAYALTTALERARAAVEGSLAAPHVTAIKS